jgi:hypothetical protein
LLQAHSFHSSEYPLCFMSLSVDLFQQASRGEPQVLNHFWLIDETSSMSNGSHYLVKGFFVTE